MADGSGAVPARVFLVYACFLAATGWYGAFVNDFRGKAMHSLYSGLGGALAMGLCGIGVLSGSTEKGKPGYRLFMVVIHLGLMLVALFAVVFGIQFTRSFNGPDGVRTKLFAIMGSGSLCALIALVKTKPKKQKKDKA